MRTPAVHNRAVGWERKENKKLVRYSSLVPETTKEPNNFCTELTILLKLAKILKKTSSS